MLFDGRMGSCGEDLPSRGKSELQKPARFLTGRQRAILMVS